MGCSAAIAAMSGARIGQLVLGDTAQAQSAGSDELLVVVFLRGGCDGLSMLAPFSDPIYRATRGELAVPLPGALNGAWAINPNNPTYAGTGFGLNGKMPHLRDLYGSGKLAFVHAAGLKTDDTRSHFDAMDYIERGTPGEKTTGSGWITRHLQTSAAPAGFLPVLSAQPSVPASLLSYSNAVAMGSPRDFGLNAHWRYNGDQAVNPMFKTLKAMYPGGGLNPLDRAGRRTLDTIEAVRRSGAGSYTPAPGVSYPMGGFGDALRTVAQIAKLPDMNLRVATVDFGGWDTHESQANRDGGGYLPDRLGQLSAGLFAFYNDMAPFHSRLTVAVLSEFGRRLGRNASNGTDHGHGGVMMVLGDNVNGGKVYGTWPGLADLDQDQDLRITTDFRAVFSEILLKRLGNNQLGTIFPGFTAAEYGAGLGLMAGAALSPDFTSRTLDLQQAGDLPNTLYLPALSKC